MEENERLTPEERRSMYEAIEQEERRKKEEKLRQLQGETKKMEDRIVLMESQRRLKSKLKYKLILPKEVFWVLIIFGGSLAFGLLKKGWIKFKWQGVEKATPFWVGAGVVLLIVILWTSYSRVMRKKMEQDAQEMVSSGQVTFEDAFLYNPDVTDALPEKKSPEEIKLKYTIDTFESLSGVDYDLAEEEWDTVDVLTEYFYRMPAFLQTFTDHALYTVFVEIRYANYDFDVYDLKKASEEIEEAAMALEFEAQTQMAKYKESLREIVCEKMKKRFPRLFLVEVCIAVKRLS